MLIFVFLSFFYGARCAGTSVPSEIGCAADTAVQKGDRCLYAGRVQTANCEEYQHGAVWVRRGVLYCRPENARDARACAYYDAVGCNYGGKVALRAVSHLVEEFVGSDLTCFLDFVLIKYPLTPYKDILATVIPVIKFMLLGGEAPTYGVLNTEFNSWACYAPNIGEYSDRLLACACREGRGYSRGTLWIRSGYALRTLCYRPDDGPEWMQYRCNLGVHLMQSGLWPTWWIKELQVVIAFALSQHRSFSVFAGKRYSTTVYAIKAALPGRAASWDEYHDFTWAPDCRDDDPFLRFRTGDRLLSGRIDQGFYVSGSRWITKNKGRSVLRYRTGRMVVQGRHTNVDDKEPETLGWCQMITAKIKGFFF